MDGKGQACGVPQHTDRALFVDKLNLNVAVDGLGLRVRARVGMRVRAGPDPLGARGSFSHARWPASYLVERQHGLLLILADVLQKNMAKRV